MTKQSLPEKTAKLKSINDNHEMSEAHRNFVKLLKDNVFDDTDKKKRRNPTHKSWKRR